MYRIVRIAVAASGLALLAIDALAQSMGPITTVPWGSRQRTKPAPAENTAVDSSGQQVQSAPAAAKPLEAAPEATTPKAER